MLRSFASRTESALAGTAITPIWNEGSLLRFGEMAIDLGRSIHEEAGLAEGVVS